MHKEVEAMLERSPRPAIWTAPMLGLLVIAAVWQSITIGIVAGIVIGRVLRKLPWTASGHGRMAQGSRH